MDVTPIDRQTWGGFTMLGFWFSDALNAQGWEAPASILAVGLTWYGHSPPPAIILLTRSGVRQSTVSYSVHSAVQFLSYSTV